MTFAVKKVENCFADAQTYEYSLPITGEEMLQQLPGWQIRRNLKLRRPVGIAEKAGVTIKATLAGSAARVSFPDACWAAEKEKFERWLEDIHV